MTREEATEILRDLWCYKHSCRYSDKEIRASIDMAIEALEQAESRWIPCSERLPEKTEENDGNEYLVYEENGFSDAEITTAFWELNGDDEWEWSDGFVKAWMPLPELYRG